MTRFLIALVFAFISAISFAQSSPPEADAKVVNPKLIKQVEPKFPPHYPLGHYVVTVNFVLDTAGVPTKLRIYRSDNSLFNESAIQAVEKYRFTPALKNGQPVSMPLNINVVFESWRPAVR